jgi:hypothetical protein
VAVEDPKNDHLYNFISATIELGRQHGLSFTEWRAAMKASFAVSEAVALDPSIEDDCAAEIARAAIRHELLKGFDA